VSFVIPLVSDVGIDGIGVQMSQPVPTEKAHAAASFVARYCVALLRPDPASAGGVRMVGSGTLVQFRARRFILTATHVWQTLRNHDAIHFTMAREMNHSTYINKDALTAYSLDDIPYQYLTPTSPDLTLLELNPIDANRIETRLGFTPLNRAFKAREDELHQDILVAGAPGVLGKSEWDHLAFELRAVFANGEIREETEGDLAFITIKPSQDEDSPIEAWGGMSGGGLWLVSYFPKADGEIDYDAFLLGVAFFQIGEEIRCHSRKSIAKLAQKVLETK
jgi:hypothetical protein